MKRISLSLLIFVMFIHCGFGQELDLTALSNNQFTTAEDYEAFEPEVLNCITWLKSNPVDHPDRKAVNAIVLAWLTGTPNVSVELNAYVTDFSGKNPDLLMIFMGGWTEYVLGVGESNATALASHTKGLEAVIEYYEKRKEYGLSKDGKVERLVKLRNQGKLASYVEENL